MGSLDLPPVASVGGRLATGLLDVTDDLAALGAALAAGNPAPYSAVVRLPAQGVHIASASPERFLLRDDAHEAGAATRAEIEWHIAERARRAS